MVRSIMGDERVAAEPRGIGYSYYVALAPALVALGITATLMIGGVRAATLNILGRRVCRGGCCLKL